MYKYIKEGDSLIIISGPTASGKTKTAINLAKAINGEIISCDSMQVYKKMDIGTAKPTSEEMEGVPHHLIDIINPEDDFSIVTFKEKVFEAMEDIKSRGKVPILCGGTGFYTNAIIYNTNFSEMAKDEVYRDELFKLVEEKGNEYLFNMLKEVDFESTLTLHENNVKKVVRALEFYKLTGEKISVHNEFEKNRKPFFKTFHFILDINREKLYYRIDKRVDIMVENGLTQEVEDLIKSGLSRTLVSMQGIGYQEFFKYFDGELNIDETINLIKKNSRNYAKRQLTWFRNKSQGIWLNMDILDEVTVIEEIKKKIFKEV
ncbi:MAG: tRNA (adenosine(37)-N6)-dimethylallyltransferase MiaA [Lachnospirales bacterium]